MKRANGVVDDDDGNPAKLCVSERAERAPGPLATLLGAIRDGDEAQVEAALRDGASVDSTITLAKDEFENLSAGATSVLIFAIAQGHNGIVQLLLERGADVHWARPHNGADVLWCASAVGHVEVVRLLAELGANVETPDKDGTTPAWIAAQNGHVEVVRVLAELGANINTPKNDGATPAYIASAEGHANVVRLLASLNYGGTWSRRCAPPSSQPQTQHHHHGLR